MPGQMHTPACFKEGAGSSNALTLWCAVGLARFLLLCYMPDPLPVLFNIPLAASFLPSLKGIPGRVCACVWVLFMQSRAKLSLTSSTQRTEFHACCALAGWGTGTILLITVSLRQPFTCVLGHVVLISLIRILYMAELLSSCKLA